MDNEAMYVAYFSLHSNELTFLPSNEEIKMHVNGKLNSISIETT